MRSTRCRLRPPRISCAQPPGDGPHVRRLRVSKLAGYLGLAATGLLGALALGLPELAAVTAPFALLAALGVAAARVPSIDASVSVSTERALEGDEVDVVLR